MSNMYRPFAFVMDSASIHVNSQILSLYES